MNVKKAIMLVLVLASVLIATAQVPAPEAAANVDKPAAAEAPNLALSRKLEVPYLSLYYLKPVIMPEEKLTVKFYVTDWYQSEVRYHDATKRFTVTITVDGPDNVSRPYVQKDLPAGDHTFVCKDQLKSGDYRLAVEAVDQQDRHAPVMYQEFRVRTSEEQKITAAQTYTMTAADLTKYGISKAGDYGVLHFIDATGKNVEETKALVGDAAKNLTPPDGKYMIVVGAEKAPAGLIGTNDTRGAYQLPTPEWIPNSWSWRSCQVLYAPTYDKEKVEAEAVATGTGLNQLMQDARAGGKRKVVLLPGTYRISQQATLKIPSGLTLDLNGATVKLNQFTGNSAVMISITHGIDSHVTNGIVEGDYFEHDYANSPNNSEWVLGVGIFGDSRYSSFKNLVVRYITGYGVTNGFNQAFAAPKSFKSFTPGTLDRQTGEEVAENGLYLSDMTPIGDYRKEAGYLTVSRVLGYQGRAFDEWNMLYHFYDKDKKYLETIDGWQYRRTRIPATAEFLRVTVWSKTPPEKGGGVAANLFKIPWNCTFENIYIQNARCVGMAPSAMFNQKIANCTFVRSGENSANCAFDAEDGWDMMQDVWIYRNRFLMNTLNELLTCAGHNFIIEENEAKLHLWSRTASYVVRNNVLKSANFGYAGRTRTLLPRIENNTYSGGVTLGDKGDDSIMQRMQAFVKGENGKVLDGSWFLMLQAKKLEGANMSCNENGVFVGATLDNMKDIYRLNLLYSSLRNTKIGALGQSRFLNSILENVSGTVYNAMLPITGCHLKNVSVNMGNGSEVVIRDCMLEDVTFSHGYWTTPTKVTLINCTVKNTNGQPLFRTPSYSIGDFKFINCAIDTGGASVIELYDVRPQATDKDGGTVRFENTTIINTAGYIVKSRDSQKNVKPLVFEFVGTQFNGEGVEKPSPAWKVDVSNAAPQNDARRGWDPTIEKTILDWLNR